MVKLFVGNISDGVSGDMLEKMFAEYGKVTECAVLGNYGFVHMETEHDAELAIKNMDKRDVHGSQINVEMSKSGARGARGRDGTSSSMRGGWGVHTATFGGGFPSTDNSASAKSARRAGCTKLHVASLPENCQSAELRRMFERYGYVAECDVVEDRNIAFVHIEDSAAEAAIHGLNGFGLRGTQIKVQLSKNQSNQGAHSGGLGGADRGFMRGQQGRVGMMGRGGGRLGGYPPNARPGYNEMTSEAERSFGPNGDSSFESALPPPAKDRLELLELLDRRRRLEALDPYERRLIACPDPFNLPPPPPEYLRLVRERSLVRARLPLPPSSTVLGRSLPTAGSTTSSSALARALVARRAAASAAQVKQDHLHAAGAGLEPYADPKALSYANMYASEY